MASSGATILRDAGNKDACGTAEVAAKSLIDLPPEIIELILGELPRTDLCSCLTVHSNIFHTGWRLLWQHLDLSGRTVRKLRLVESVLRGAVETVAADERGNQPVNGQLPPFPGPITFPAPPASFPPSLPGSSLPSGEKRGRWNGIVKKKRAWHAEAAENGGGRSQRSGQAAPAPKRITRPKLGQGQPYHPSAVRKITYRNGDFADLGPLLILCGPHVVWLDVRGCSFRTAVTLSLFDLVNSELKELDMSIDFVGPQSTVQDVESLLDPGHREVGTAVARFRNLRRLGVGNRNLTEEEVNAVMELGHLTDLELAEDRAWKIHESARKACSIPTLQKLKFSSLDFEIPVTFFGNLVVLELSTHVANRLTPANDMGSAIMDNQAVLANLKELRLGGPVSQMPELFLTLSSLPFLELFEMDYQAPSYPVNVMNQLVAGVGMLARKHKEPNGDGSIRPLLHLGLSLNLNDRRHATIVESLAADGPIPLRSLRFDPRRAKVAKGTIDAIVKQPEGTFPDLETFVVASRKMRTDSIARLLPKLPKLRRLRWLVVHPQVLPRLRTDLKQIDEELRRRGGGWEIDMNPLRIVVEIRGRFGLQTAADWARAARLEAGTVIVGAAEDADDVEDDAEDD